MKTCFQITETSLDCGPLFNLLKMETNNNIITVNKVLNTGKSNMHCNLVSEINSRRE